MNRLFNCLKKYKLITVLAPLCKLLEALLELFIPILVAQIIDIGIKNGDINFIIVRACLMALLGLIGLVFSICGQYFSAKASINVASDMRSSLFKKLQSLRFKDIDNLGKSKMITSMTSDINQVQTGINLTLRLLLRSPFVVFGACIMAFTIDVNISLIFIIIVTVLAIIVFFILLTTMPYYKKSQENLDDVTKSVRENLVGVRVIRAFCSEDSEVESFNNKTNNLYKVQNKIGKISSFLNPLTYAVINVGIIFVIYFGAMKVNVGNLSQGKVIALYNYMSQILVELVKLANLIITISKSIACSKRIDTLFEIDTTMEISQNNVEASSYIEFNNVSFKYKETSDYALQNINFSVEKGQSVGIIGGTGSGKTTLINLIARFYDVTDGYLSLDGKNVNSFDLVELRDQVSIVRQKAELFKGTIKENLLWGNGNASDKELFEALEVAQAKEVVDSKGGLDAVVEQYGKNFSGGQKQRLSIARAIVKKSPILILDDSSSALDYITDLKLRQSISGLTNKPTLFIISQRTTSVMNLDKIIVLDNGKIVGIGKHEELLQNCEIYKEIYQTSLKNEN